MASRAIRSCAPPSCGQLRVEQRGQVAPSLMPIRTALDHDMIDEPALKPTAPGPDIDLDPVLLHVGAGGQEQPARRIVPGLHASRRS